MSRQNNISNKIRLNLTMNTSVKEKLDELLEKTQADSMSEVIRRSLAVYDFLITKKNKGYTTIIRGDGKEMEVEIL